MPQKKKQDVIFRRVRGRIIPIRIKRGVAVKMALTRARRKEIKRGIGEAVSGLGIAAASGAVSGQIIRLFRRKAISEMAADPHRRRFKVKSKFKNQRRFGFRSMGSARATKNLQSAFRLTRGIKATTLVVGATLFSTGVEKLIPRRKGETVGEELARAGVATAATFAIAANAPALGFFIKRIGLRRGLKAFSKRKLEF